MLVEFLTLGHFSRRWLVLAYLRTRQGMELQQEAML
jgi:hypothetical protein